MYATPGCSSLDHSQNSTDGPDSIPIEQEIFSIFATVLGILSWLPQIWRLYKTKSSKDLSEPTLIIILVASVCALGYTLSTVYATNVMVVLASVINLLVCGLTLFLAIRYRPFALAFPVIEQVGIEG